ncbi:hypothetical protein [Aeromicrobium sp. UC242_57]|uniref:hypothetical protein n=1 Tax=Aeromicrobium sp. UC242_57 TaxID=3374624 RepID=UPI0037AF3B7B
MNAAVGRHSREYSIGEEAFVADLDYRPKHRGHVHTIVRAESINRLRAHLSSALPCPIVRSVLAEFDQVAAA